jgi:hypothetical protein
LVILYKNLRAFGATRAERAGFFFIFFKKAKLFDFRFFEKFPINGITAMVILSALRAL